MNAIETQSLSKRFDSPIPALDELNLGIPPGTVFALLGPNGSGKTTSVRLLNGILTPTHGKAFIHGLPVTDHLREVHAICGVMTETAHPYENLSADENLTFFGRMQGMNDSNTRARADYLLSFFSLEKDRARPVKAFSTGMKKRLLLSIAMLHRPKVLFLDEPTSGLDPEAAKTVNDLIKRLAEEEKVTTFLCTHQLRYAEDICSQFGFIHLGRLLGLGTFQELLQRYPESKHLHLRGENLPAEFEPFREKETGFKIPITGDQDAEATIRRIIQQGGRIFEARQRHPSLEDLYFSYQKGTIP